MVKRLTKRFMAFFLAVVFTAMLLPTIPAMAATSGTCGENVTWTLDNGTLTISGEGTMTYWSWSGEIPWYSNREDIKTAVIENGVTSIGDYAFEYCRGLTSVTIPNSVTEIAVNAFYGCSSLTSVTIPDSVTSIGLCAFYGCSRLTSVTIPDSVTEIGGWAFYGCRGLTSVTIPDSVTSIGSRAFYGCSSLTSVTIPDSVTSIDSSAFGGCSGLTSIDVDKNNENYCSADGNLFNKDKTKLIQYAIGKTDTAYIIPDSVTSIAERAFENCTRLTNVTIPHGVTSIGERAFDGCTGLTNITIPDSVTRIDYCAFEGCRGLTSVTIPNSVIEISSSAFYSCTGLTSIDVDENNEYYCSADGNLFNKDKTILIQYAIGKKDATYTIPESVTEIGWYAFYRCTGLTSVTIPESVTSIGRYAFADCTGLASVTIPDSVTGIGEYAFYRCTGLTSVTIPDSVTEIGWGAFEGCTAITDIYYTGTEDQWNAINIYSNNDPLTKATIHYNYTPTTAEIPTVGEYADKLDIVMTKTGGEVKIEITAKGDTAISADDIQVLAMPTSGNATILAPTVDGGKIVYSGNIAGEDYRIFVWTKNLVPITNVFDSSK